MEWEWRPWSLEGLRGIEPHEVMQALNAARTLRRWADDNVLAVFSQSSAGRRLVVALYEDVDVWVVIGARDMSPDEAALFDGWMTGGEGK